MSEENNNGLFKIQNETNQLIDDLLSQKDFGDLQTTADINNRMRYAMLRIINANMVNAASDPKMITAWKGLLKDIDSAIFMIARLSQEDRHLDNEELVAQALNAVTQRVRKNPFKDPTENIIDDLIVEPPKLDVDAFDFAENSDQIGLVEMDYQSFQERIDKKKLVIALEDSWETKPETSASTKPLDLNRDAPLTPPLPGQFL